MKNAIALALAAALSVPVFAGSPVHAQSAYSSRQLSVTVIFVKDWFDDDDEQISLKYRYPSAETISFAQEEIRSNPDIRDTLRKKRVQLRNVVGVQTAFNGGKIAYVR